MCVTASRETSGTAHCKVLGLTTLPNRVFLMSWETKGHGAQTVEQTGNITFCVEVRFELLLCS